MICPLWAGMSFKVRQLKNMLFKKFAVSQIHSIKLQIIVEGITLKKAIEKTTLRIFI